MFPRAPTSARTSLFTHGKRPCKRIKLYATVPEHPVLHTDTYMANYRTQGRGRHRTASPPRCRSRRVPLALLVLVVSAVALPNPSPGDLLLDWSEWEKKQAPRNEVDDVASVSVRRIPDSPCVGGSEGSRPCQPRSGQELRRLVKECSTRLEFPGNPCKDKEEPVLEDDYRVPFMESSSGACGFEVRFVRGRVIIRSAPFLPPAKFLS